MELPEVVDRLLIAETLHTYSDRVDRSDIDGVVDLFTDDAVLDMGRGTVVTGHRELRPLVIRLVGRWTTTSHHCSTTSVTSYDAREATTATYVYVFHDRPADDLTMHLWGRYDDVLVKQGGRWQIRHRVFRVAGVRHTASSELPDRFEPFPRLPLPAG